MQENLNVREKKKEIPMAVWGAVCVIFSDTPAGPPLPPTHSNTSNRRQKIHQLIFLRNNSQIRFQPMIVPNAFCQIQKQTLVTLLIHNYGHTNAVFGAVVMIAACLGILMSLFTSLVGKQVWRNPRCCSLRVRKKDD